MNDKTVASKLNRLLQKSRQAYRVYAAMSKTARSEGNLYSELQANEWMRVNADLVKQLSLLIDRGSLKNLTHNISRMRLSVEQECQRVEALLQAEQQDLIASSKRGDFIRCAQLSSSLISRKGFIQATKAVVNELQSICGAELVCGAGTDVSALVMQQAYTINYGDTVNYSDFAQQEEEIAVKERPDMAKVIQLRR